MHQETVNCLLDDADREISRDTYILTGDDILSIQTKLHQLKDFLNEIYKKRKGNQQ